MSARVSRSTHAQSANRPARREIRARLELGDCPTVLIVIPAKPLADPLHALWASLIVSKVVPDLRIVLPGAGSAIDRLYRFAVANITEARTRFTADRLSIEELVSAADTVLRQAGDREVENVAAQAVASGLPLIEWRAEGVGAASSKESPRAGVMETARRVLRAIESASAKSL
ncbi:MAG: hypothetical protein KDA32_11340 [Phycisphaerales bacterium]|nr:hypothetical protein [Phycisphaerales bacterium]